ncbi:MAG: DUF4261 domain-containing protein [Helicobacteraceae bacterium]|jgi:hypothetical protein|nr:DUF4261 domain-containing protein [Helicobacteraceae bacterium]
MSGETLRQDLTKEAKFSGVYAIDLLFKNGVEAPNAAFFYAKLEEKFGRVDIVSDSADLYSFALLDYAYGEKAKTPSMILIASCNELKKPLGDQIARSQFWEVKNGAAVLDSLPFSVIISDFMAAGLDPITRSGVLADWLDIALDLYPECEAIFFQPSAKLLLADQWRENPYNDRGAPRFLYGGMNIRNFRIDGTNDRLVDTLGLFAFGLADIQYHFRALDLNEIVGHAFNTAIYQFENGEPIESGHTIEGVSEGEKWRCQYENALIQPAREVLDVAAGKYAAGKR